jgi:hypothetical protein
MLSVELEGKNYDRRINRKGYKIGVSELRHAGTHKKRSL